MQANPPLPRYVPRPRAQSSDSKPRMALDDFLDKLRPFAGAPQLHPVPHTIDEAAHGFRSK